MKIEITSKEWAILMTALDNNIYERKQNELDVEAHIALYNKMQDWDTTEV